MIVKLEVEIEVTVVENDTTFWDIGTPQIRSAVQSAVQTSLNNSYHHGYTHALEDEIRLSKAKVVLTGGPLSEVL